MVGRVGVSVKYYQQQQQQQQSTTTHVEQTKIEREYQIHIVCNDIYVYLIGPPPV